MQGENPIAGVIYDFNTGTLYSGLVSEGITINGHVPGAEWAGSIDQSALITGIPAGMVRSPERMQAFVDRISVYKKVRMVGSASMALAYVATKMYDVYYEEAIRLWDVAAGLALVKAAGGSIRLTPSATGKLMAYDIWAGNEEFFQD